MEEQSLTERQTSGILSRRMIAIAKYDRFVEVVGSHARFRWWIRIVVLDSTAWRIEIYYVFSSNVDLWNDIGFGGFGMFQVIIVGV